MSTKIVATDRNVLEDLYRVRRELDDIIETIEVLSNPELVEELRKAREEAYKGEIISIKELIEDTEKELTEKSKKS